MGQVVNKNVGVQRILNVTKKMEHVFVYKMPLKVGYSIGFLNLESAELKLLEI